MARKFLFIGLMCLGVSFAGLASPYKVASFKTSGGVAWTDYNRSYGDSDHTSSSYDPYNYQNINQSTSMEGAVHLGFSAEFYLRRRLAIGFSYKKNTANLAYKNSITQRWGETTHSGSESSYSPLYNGRKDIAFYMKAFLNRNLYIKTGLGYAFTPQPYSTKNKYHDTNSHSTYSSDYIDSSSSGLTLPFALGTEWNFGAFDFAVDWVSVNLSLDRLTPTYDHDYYGYEYGYKSHKNQKSDDLKPFHEISIGTISLGVSI